MKLKHEDAQWQAMDGTLLQAPTRSQKISD